MTKAKTEELAVWKAAQKAVAELNGSWIADATAGKSYANRYPKTSDVAAAYASDTISAIDESNVISTRKISRIRRVAVYKIIRAAIATAIEDTKNNE